MRRRKCSAKWLENQIDRDADVLRTRSRAFRDWLLAPDHLVNSIAARC